MVWQSLGSSADDSSSYSIQAQRYDANGLPLDAEFQINSYTTNQQRFPALAMDPQGYFVVTWQSDGSAGGDSSDTSILGQRYTAAGTPLGSEFQINTFTEFEQEMPPREVVVGRSEDGQPQRRREDA